jgi:hypothetical protein
MVLSFFSPPRGRRYRDRLLPIARISAASALKEIVDIRRAGCNDKAGANLLF